MFTSKPVFIKGIKTLLSNTTKSVMERIGNTKYLSADKKNSPKTK
jgi:hypothetical protein